MTTFFWTKYPFVRVGLTFTIGIFLAYMLLPIPEHNLTIVQIYIIHGSLLAIWLFILLLFFRQRNQNGFLFILLFLTLGFFRFALEDPRINPLHISHNNINNISFLKGTIDTEPEIKKEKTSFNIRLEHIKVSNTWLPCTGIVKTYCSTKTPLQLGDQVIVQGSPKNIGTFTTPFDFNYAQYLVYQKVSLIVFTQYPIIQLKHNTDSFLYFLKNKAITCRLFIESIIKKRIQTPRSQSIIIALLTGKKSTITREDKDLFSNSGTIHILAISGMHVVFIYQIILGLFLVLKVNSKHYSINLLILALVWFYIFISGLQASTVRAGIMLSIILIGKITKQTPQPINSLFAAAFCMLLYNPYYIADIGFCLSFLAIIGIILVSQINTSHKGLKAYFINAMSISTGAQICTLPYSLFLFQQFPVYFLVANLIVVPIATLLLSSTLALIVLNSIPYLSNAIAFFINHLCHFLFYSINIINQLPYHLINNVSINTFEVFLAYFMLSCIVYAIATRKKQALWTFALSSCLFSLSVTYRMLYQYQQTKLVISGYRENRQYILTQNNCSYIFKSEHSLSNSYCTEKVLSESFTSKTKTYTIPDDVDFKIDLNGQTLIYSIKQQSKKDFTKFKNSSLTIIDFENKSSYLKAPRENDNKFIFSNGKESIYIKNIIL